MELSKEERKQQKALRRMEKERLVVQTAGTQITILCVRFGNRYGREYVERLRNMVARHMTIPYEFACLTDDQHPIPGVRSIYQQNAGYSKGWWHKVHMFDHKLPLVGRILYFDLDVVIHDNIDKLAMMFKDQFMGIHDFNRKFFANWKYLNSSVMAWDHGSQNYIWDQFKSNPKEAMRLQGDQDWIWKLGKDRIRFWPMEWIQSYKWEIRSREELTMVEGKRKFKQEDHAIQLHPDCCVTVFHGDPKPQDVKDKFVVDNWC
jgi:hypothetical protein